MTDKLTYSGELIVSPSFSDEEVNFLNLWQNVLSQHFFDIDNNHNINIKNQHYDGIKNFVGLPLDDKQLWLLKFSFNPLIRFEHDKIIISGEHSKGQLRDALLMYQHFFFSEDPFLKKYLSHIDFFNTHTFNGIIECEKQSYKTGFSQWCYIAENSIISSVNAKTKFDYIKKSHKYLIIFKEDKFESRINQYFPKNSPIVQFLALNLKLSIKHNYIKRIKI